MAESSEDRSVDEIIARLRKDLDALEAAQKKDVADEDSEESSEEPKDLKGAEKESLRRIRSARKNSD